MNNPNEHVDPFIGVGWPGNCLCGPYLPMSLVRPGPDCQPPVDTTGYAPGRPIIHFSHTHVSGTGGSGRYGNVGVVPFAGPSRFELDPFPPADEFAEPGYYSVRLQPDNVRVELTCTPRVGVHRYTFPEGAESNVLIKPGSVIKVGDGTPGDTLAVCTGGFVEVLRNRDLAGRADFKGGWGHSFPYSIFFFGRFDRPVRQWQLAGHDAEISATFADGPDARAVASFGAAPEINLRVGISHVSMAKARASVERETGEKDFDTIREQAANIWNKSLSRIRIEGGSEEQKKLFYTLFYRLTCMPTHLGVDDENPLWISGIRQFTDFYCLWDSVRNANSFISLFDPDLETELLNALLDIGDHTGWIPDAWIAGHSAMIQGGCSADILFCEAALKGLKGIDYNKALKHMRRGAETVSPNPNLYGRYTEEYAELGYLSTRIGNCVSRHLEYAYQDWCIGTLARLLDKDEVASKYMESSKKAWNLWREDIKAFAPKKPDGSWVEPFDPKGCRPDSWNDPFFYEGTSIQWSFSVHHDFHGLIRKHGGPEAFIRHLDEFFDVSKLENPLSFPRAHYFSKETMLHIPYLYTYAGRPDRTAECVSECMSRYFKPERNGLVDNEDMGCQSAFYMCSAIGLYPIMGQDLYMISTPVFERMEIDIGTTDIVLTIEAPGASEGNRYITAATLNGTPVNRAWLRHSEIADGGTLRYELASIPSDWGTTELPPSPLSAS